METLTIDATEDSPQVIFDKKNGIFEISGRSFPEDSAVFYNRVLKWIDTYRTTPNEKSNFVFKLEYSNTASSKFILDIMLALSKIKGIQVSWYCQEDDEDMQEAGREFSEQVEMPFEVILY